MEYSYFTKLATEEISEIYNLIETAIPDLDIDLINDVLYINTEKGDYVINQHYPSQQIWLSSPISNAGYFNYDPTKKDWIDKNNLSIRQRLYKDLGIIGF
jgi:frataxin-like iron-binding protein CyaY